MNKDLKDCLELLERERKIDRESLLGLLENSMCTALTKSTPYRHELITVTIDRKTLEYSCSARLIVADPVAIPSDEIELAQAKKQYPEAKVGDEIVWKFDPAVFGRIAASYVKQNVISGLGQAERKRQCELFGEQVMQLLNGQVKRIEREGIVINFGTADGYLPKEERIPGENFELDEIVTVLLIDVNADKPGPALTVSRRHPDFVRRLFEREVTEISNNLVTIRGIAREAGYRTKIAVSTNEPRIDPMGACVGVRGSRVRNIVRELGGEKVDIIQYSDDIKTYITNALKPARLNTISVDSEKKLLTITVDDDQQPLAIGKKGQNTRLATRLTGWKIDIVKEQAAPVVENDYDTMKQRAIDMISALDGVTPEEAKVLVENGYVNAEGILAAEDYIDDVANLPGFNQERAIAVIEAARASLNK